METGKSGQDFYIYIVMRGWTCWTGRGREFLNRLAVGGWPQEVVLLLHGLVLPVANSELAHSMALVVVVVAVAVAAIAVTFTWLSFVAGVGGHVTA